MSDPAIEGLESSSSSSSSDESCVIALTTPPFKKSLPTITEATKQPSEDQQCPSHNWISGLSNEDAATLCRNVMGNCTLNGIASADPNDVSGDQCSDEVLVAASKLVASRNSTKEYLPSELNYYLVLVVDKYAAHIPEAGRVEKVWRSVAEDLLVQRGINRTGRTWQKFFETLYSSWSPLSPCSLQSVSEMVADTDNLIRSFKEDRAAATTNSKPSTAAVKRKKDAEQTANGKALRHASALQISHGIIQGAAGCEVILNESSH